MHASASLFAHRKHARLVIDVLERSHDTGLPESGEGIRQTDVVLASGYAARDAALAGARAEAIREWLSSHGVRVTETSTSSPGASPALAQRHGDNGLRVVRIDVGAAP